MKEIVCFGVYLLSQDFYILCQNNCINIKGNKLQRPFLIIKIDPNDYYCCVPLTSDNDKNGKYKAVSQDKPDFCLTINKISRKENYLLIQDLFIVHKRYVYQEFSRFENHVRVRDKNKKEEIKIKINKFLKLFFNNKIFYIDIIKIVSIQNIELTKKTKTKILKYKGDYQLIIFFSV